MSVCNLKALLISAALCANKAVGNQQIIGHNELRFRLTDSHYLNSPQKKRTGESERDTEE